MWTTAYRDAALVESLGASERSWFTPLDRALEVLAKGRELRGRRRMRVIAALRLAVDFPTWRTLAASGVGDRDTADVAAFVAAASPEAQAGPRGRRAAPQALSRE